jgi:pimeloyl-ACP methyl ester carboxylesterase
MDQATNVRQLPAQFDERGNPFWTTRMSTPDDSYAQIAKVPNRVIPVIFVPGVMGSNLLGTGNSKRVRWLLDSAGSMSGWLSKGAEYRKQHLRPEVMVVADDGKLPTDTRLPPEELKRRGWGEVGFMSYGAALSWFENQLNDYDQADTGERSQLRQRALQALQGEATLTDDEFELSYRYLLPVYACGYNWLDSNVASAKRLGQLIDAVVQRYKLENKKCEKVILVTHSMGGLMARHCSEVLGYRDKIFGIVHGVMPDLGAAAVYRRFKAGTEGDLLASLVLGSNAAEMTAVLSSAPGPLQLLPTPEYGNGWLKIEDGKQTHSLPANGDPYGEIYAVRGKWWSMCEDHLINPLNKETDPQRRADQVDKDWASFSELVVKVVKDFQIQIKNKYHANTHAFFGSHTSNKAYGAVFWRSGHLQRLNVHAPEGTADDRSETGSIRTISAPVTGEPHVQQQRRFTISDPDEDGDGTVPHRSGIAPRAACISLLQVNVGHEPAFRHTEGADNLRACRFTLRAIARIAQEVNKTTLKYD